MTHNIDPPAPLPVYQALNAILNLLVTVMKCKKEKIIGGYQPQNRLSVFPIQQIEFDANG